MTTTYLAVIQQIWGHEDADGVWRSGVYYLPYGEPHMDRASLLIDTEYALDHDDFNVLTLVDGKPAGFGYGDKDFGPEDDGTPHGGYNLDEIARACGLAGTR
jgi:hypothetical protein